MRHFIIIVTISSLLLSCGENSNKQKELELKEKELNLKETNSVKTTATVDTIKKNLSQEAVSEPLVLTPLKVDGDIGNVTFSQNNKTVFYYDAKSKKGKINLNGAEHILTKMEMNGSYKLSGSNVNITTTRGKWEEMESDCGYGKSLVVTIKMGTQILKLNNVEVQDCSSMVE
ncbi:MAG: hypothetical protein IPP81_20060 [Chitinophagaceae bacterium]|nr:hypothetical protein [Chitinophagaceae bacterium]